MLIPNIFLSISRAYFKVFMTATNIIIWFDLWISVSNASWQVVKLRQEIFTFSYYNKSRKRKGIKDVYRFVECKRIRYGKSRIIFKSFLGDAGGSSWLPASGSRCSCSSGQLWWRPCSKWWITCGWPRWFVSSGWGRWSVWF